MSVMPLSQECKLGWPAYPLPRFDQKDLSWMTEYYDIISGSSFQPWAPNQKFITVHNRTIMKVVYCEQVCCEHGLF